MPKGEISHVELPADDPERAKRFYAAVAGWEFSEMTGMPGYFLFRTGEKSGGGIGRRGDTVGDAVRVYVTVDNLEQAAAAVAANGGRIVEGPIQIPGSGRYSTVIDPEGNEIAIWEDGPAA